LTFTGGPHIKLCLFNLHRFRFEISKGISESYLRHCGTSRHLFLDAAGLELSILPSNLHFVTTSDLILYYFHHIFHLDMFHPDVRDESSKDPFRNHTESIISIDKSVSDEIFLSILIIRLSYQGPLPHQEELLLLHRHSLSLFHLLPISKNTS
jgi:hypothetical protein